MRARVAAEMQAAIDRLNSSWQVGLLHSGRAPQIAVRSLSLSREQGSYLTHSVALGSLSLHWVVAAPAASCQKGLSFCTCRLALRSWRRAERWEKRRHSCRQPMRPSHNCKSACSRCAYLRRFVAVISPYRGCWSALCRVELGTDRPCGARPMLAHHVMCQAACLQPLIRQLPVQ